MDVGSNSGYVAGDQSPWANHPAHKTHELGPEAVENALATNIPNPWEQFVLAEGEKKVEEETDTRTASTSIFTFNKEDHTLGNLLRDKLLENSHVLFSAYKVPHPLFAKFELRVQTDGQITPKEAVVAASVDIIKDLNTLQKRFTEAYELTKMVQAGQNGA